MIFHKNKTDKDIEKDDKDLIKLAKKYIKQLEEAEYLPSNSKDMYKIIKKAGLR